MALLSWSQLQELRAWLKGPEGQEFIAASSKKTPAPPDTEDQEPKTER